MLSFLTYFTAVLKIRIYFNIVNEQFRVYIVTGYGLKILLSMCNFLHKLSMISIVLELQVTIQVLP